MSRHEGVSCDSCLKGNFRGKRYKCLICYDYDLCSTCYEAGATTTRHTPDHPMQCILTRTDFDLFYGSEALTAEQPQAFTCPFCGRMGHTETSLHDHVNADHQHSSTEVVCPICASLPGGDPNHVTDDFGAHLALEHRAPRDFDEPMGSMRHVRRIQHPGGGRGGSRPRRNMAFQPTSIAAASSALSGLSPRETMDPIAELLSQLSSVRSRAAAAQNVSTQLQQLEMQLQSTRAQLERLPRRQTQTESTSKTAQSANNLSSTSSSSASGQQSALMDFSLLASTTPPASSNTNSQYLLSRLGEAEACELDKQAADTERADRAAFIHELLLSSLSRSLRLDSGQSGDVSESSLDSTGLDTPRQERNSDESQSENHKEGDGHEEGGGNSDEQATAQDRDLSPKPSPNASPNMVSGERGASKECEGACQRDGEKDEWCAATALKNQRVNSAGAHRNLVKYRDASKKIGKEPPPPTKPH